MMVSYHGLLRDVTRKAHEERVLPAATLGDLLHDLVAAYGPKFAQWVMPEGARPGSAIILVDGQDLRGLRGFETPLKPDTEIVIFPPLAGG